jgi:hypothetical protein
MKMEKLIAFLEKKTEIISMDCDPDKEAYIVEVRGERELLERVKEQLEKFNQLEYINS